MVTHTSKPWLFFVLLLVLSYYRASFAIAADTLSAGQPLSMGETIISEGSNFELGFFRPGSSSKIYLGIWYRNYLGGVQEKVWVANRENPLSDASSSKLELSEDGNLVMLAGSSKIPFWSTNLKNALSNSTEAVLLDDGNFVLRDSSNKNTIFWESFDHPTDTWLPGAKLGIDKITGKLNQLISWKNSEDPAPGMFSFRLARDGSEQFILEWNRSQMYASSGVWDDKNKSFSLAPDMLNYITNPIFVTNEYESYFTYSIKNSSPKYRFVLNSSGLLQQLAWSEKSWDWTLFWSRPVNIYDVYGLCGAFGLNYENFSNPCVCLKGFKPFSIEETSLSDWSGGCVRKSPLQCMNNTYANGKKDWFKKIPILRFPVNSKAVSAMNCEVACMNDCSCTAYAYNSSGYCMIWKGVLLNLQQLSDGGKAGQHIYLRLAADEYQESGNKWKVWVILAVMVTATAIGLILFLSICFSRKRKLRHKHKGEETSRYDLLLFDFSSELHGINDGTNTKDNVNIRGKKDGELPVFSYDSVSAATNNFSTVNKLGQGGFGPVFKGKSFKGQEIAVKMLSKRSRQGLEEFRNETTLIAKFQHRNLVRLLGCCIEQDEKMLIYEYMPNKSLDFYLFDQIKKMVLDWETRIHIIEGIAQGLLYLHQYSRLRIIHRDLKPSNILLDTEMNPKISDFGMARIVGDNETQTNTNRIVGTYYMSPEYVMDGLYSIKSDVFSFGVLLLEIVSGRKNTGFYNNESLNLLRYAWELWRDDQSLEMMEPTIGYPSSTSVLLRFINIGLLCVQESPTNRPTMLSVVSMISNEHSPLPTPKQPAFTRGRNDVMYTNSTINSVGNVTISIMEAR